MNTKLSKAALLLGIALMTVPGSFAQETKIKIEEKGYELKIKQEGDEFKYKEEGRRATPVVNTTTRARTTQKHSVHYKQGETMTAVKPGAVPQQKTVAKKATTKKPVAKKKTYAAKKPAAKRVVRKTAYKPKAKTTNRTAANLKPATVIVRDTVYVTRVDTVFSINEIQSFTGNRPNGHVLDNFKELKIERESNGEIKLKKEYDDGREMKRVFDNEHDFQTYMEWKNF